jgi:hypothetical protein
MAILVLIDHLLDAGLNKQSSCKNVDLKTTFRIYLIQKLLFLA